MAPQRISPPTPPQVAAAVVPAEQLAGWPEVSVSPDRSRSSTPRQKTSFC